MGRFGHLGHPGKQCGCACWPVDQFRSCAAARKFGHKNAVTIMGFRVCSLGCTLVSATQVSMAKVDIWLIEASLGAFEMRAREGA